MNLCLEKTTKGCTTSEMYKYSLGGCTESLILNSFFGFSMLYYTKALGLSPQLAGIATGIAALWDAISDPIMGHVSDNTKSRFGKRFPYMSGYWFGNGILMPIAISMIADVSEVNKLIKGANKDASYAAMFSLAVKISMAVSGLLAGFCLSWTGFQSGSDAVQTAESIWRVCAITFIVGPLASLAALALIMKYPVDEEFIKDIRIQYENKDNLSSVIDAGI